MIKLVDGEIRMFNIRNRTENKLSQAEDKLCAEFGSSQAEKVQATFQTQDRLKDKLGLAKKSAQGWKYI